MLFRSVPLIKSAYEKLADSQDIQVTDDTMAVEKMLGRKSKLIEGSYENIKITTSEDLEIAEMFLRRRK